MQRLNPVPYLLVLLCAMLVACASAGLPTPQTFNERVATAQASVTQMRSTATVLLNAKKISSADALNVLKQTDAAAEGIALAMLVGATNPAAGDAKLQTVMAVLSALQAYLAAKGN
jgi:hypothetical protein